MRGAFKFCADCSLSRSLALSPSLSLRFFPNFVTQLICMYARPVCVRLYHTYALYEYIFNLCASQCATIIILAQKGHIQYVKACLLLALLMRFAHDAIRGIELEMTKIYKINGFQFIFHEPSVMYFR